MFGVSMPTRTADLVHRADERVELDRAAGLDVLQHRGLEAAELAREREALLARSASIGQPMRAPISAASAMQRSMKPRTSGSSRMRSVSAPVSAETGFIVMLPQSLYQMSRRMSLARLGTRSRRSSSAAHDRRQRAPTCRRAGSPTIRPFADAVAHAPGAGVDAREVDDAAEHARERAAGGAADRRDRRSRAAARRGSAAGAREPPRHAVHRRQDDGLGPDQRRHRRRGGGERRRLDARSRPAPARRAPRHRRSPSMRCTVSCAARGSQLQPARADARERRAARKRRHLVSRGARVAPRAVRRWRRGRRWRSSSLNLLGPTRCHRSGLKKLDTIRDRALLQLREIPCKIARSFVLWPLPRAIDPTP